MVLFGFGRQETGGSENILRWQIKSAGNAKTDIGARVAVSAKDKT
jgi:hypothetical protein